MSWEPVTRFDQLKAGDTVRWAARPEVTGRYRGPGHGVAIVHVVHEQLVGSPRDVLCKLKELEVLR